MQNSMQIKFLTALLVGSLSLTGCGGGGDEAEPQPQAAQQDSNNDNGSTSLGDNPNSNGTEIDLYKTVAVDLPITEWAQDMPGNVYIVKVSTIDNQTLMVKTLNILQDLRFSASVPATVTKLVVEIYSDHPNVERIRIEVSV